MTVRSLPELSTRTYRPGTTDTAALARLIERGDVADHAPWRISVEELANWLSRANEHFDPARDVMLVHAGEELVGTWDVQWVHTNDGLREYRLGGTVDPDWRRRGIGTRLLRAAEAHARTLAREAGDERPHAYGTWQPDSRTGGAALMAQEGYAAARYFFDMVRPTLDGIGERPLPDGLELRPVTEADLRPLWDADIEAFRDHWGGFDASEERYQEWLADPKFDPSLFVVAWDGDEVAGGVVNEISETENAAFNRRRGWLASVFVRRPWRRRGLARALVAESLRRFRERGMTSAGLGVDVDNPQSALRLYEDAGFEVDIRSTAYRKPMPRE